MAENQQQNSTPAIQEQPTLLPWAQFRDDMLTSREVRRKAAIRRFQPDDHPTPTAKGRHRGAATAAWRPAFRALSVPPRSGAQPEPAAINAISQVVYQSTLMLANAGGCPIEEPGLQQKLDALA
jgi:hypothetical protein